MSCAPSSTRKPSRPPCSSRPARGSPVFGVENQYYRPTYVFENNTLLKSIVAGQLIEKIEHPLNLNRLS